jgi:hypothetical protein
MIHANPPHQRRLDPERRRVLTVARGGCGCCAPPMLGGGGKNPLQTAPAARPAELRLSDFQPRSMLHVPVTRVEKPAFPVIDVHTHLSWMSETRNGVSLGEAMSYFANPAELLPLMDRKGIRTMVNLTGGTGRGLEETIARFDAVAPGRFRTMTARACKRRPSNTRIA